MHLFIADISDPNYAADTAEADVYQSLVVRDGPARAVALAQAHAAYNAVIARLKAPKQYDRQQAAKAAAAKKGSEQKAAHRRQAAR